ncbi:RBBP9/YdeN family alpha/beta hydrolase [Dyadobacter sandarakinus]|uniref:Alpha/beta hydrolase n=1 Tax=Dyadobacter sandarakinus TaxID=2747268 RepID=A0ABX7IB03_9BACT|nr:alpha/beta hydrolase [Dyadobacter sandarakinus]QRR02121.1 alpha/beta hydrolase [Dyadobacter sandarakinus]
MNVHFLTVPGLASSGPQHWQTIWEKHYPDTFSRVQQHNWDWPVKDDWVGQLQKQVAELAQPTVLVAHSMGCITVAHWAQEYAPGQVVGALLVAPADAEQSKRLSFVVGFSPIPLKTLPFKSIVVASTNDRYATLSRSKHFADHWGSEFINLGKKGHINAVSGLGDWPEGKEILQKLGSVTPAASF